MRLQGIVLGLGVVSACGVQGAERLVTTQYGGDVPTGHYGFRCAR